EGIISSFPCTCSNGEWSIVQGLDIDEFSQGRMDTTWAELVDEQNTVGGMGLLG
ncbi:MAG: malate dehydrogenase, partial [Actinomycetota bacterium]